MRGGRAEGLIGIIDKNESATSVEFTKRPDPRAVVYHYRASQVSQCHLDPPTHWRPEGLPTLQDARKKVHAIDDNLGTLRIDSAHNDLLGCTWTRGRVDIHLGIVNPLLIARKHGTPHESNPEIHHGTPHHDSGGNPA